MGKLHCLMDLEKFKKAVHSLSTVREEAVDFLAFRGTKEGSKADEHFGGLYIGLTMSRDFVNHKSACKVQDTFKGRIFRSAKYQRRLLLESTAPLDKLKEFGRDCLRETKLHLIAVPVKPGDPEPEPTAEELKELLGTPAAPASEPAAPPRGDELVELKLEGEALIGEALQLKPALAGALEQARAKLGNFIASGHLELAHAEARQLRELVTALQRSEKGKEKVRDSNEPRPADAPPDTSDAARLLAEVDRLVAEAIQLDPDAAATIDVMRTKVSDFIKEGNFNKARANIAGLTQLIEKLHRKSGPIPDAKSAVLAELRRMQNELTELLDEVSRRKLVDRGILQPSEETIQTIVRLLKEGKVDEARDLLTQYRIAVFNARTIAKFEKRRKHAKELVADSANPDIPGLLQQYDELQDPTSFEANCRAAELYATLLTKDGTVQMANLSGASANKVYAMETPRRFLEMPGGVSSEFRYYFKPSAGETKLAGFPKGGGACREVLAKVINDEIALATGLDLGVADTSLVSIPAEVFSKSEGFAAKVTGSFQHNIHRKGEPEQKKLTAFNATERQDLPKSEVQKIQLFDLLFANLDRHEDNLMVKGKDPATAQLSPFDHGMILPSKIGLACRGDRIGRHALRGAKCNQEPLDGDLLAVLHKIDENKLADAAWQAFAAMSRMHADAAAEDMFTAENTELMKRSVRFLKRAASELTVCELFNAYLVHLQEIYGIASDDQGGDQEDEGAVFSRVIAAVKGQGNALFECAAALDDIRKACQENGWWMRQFSDKEFQVWSQFHPRQLLYIHRTDPKPQGPFVRMRLADFAPKNPDNQGLSGPELREYANEFPSDAEDRTGIGFFRPFKRAGGWPRIQQLGGCASLTNFAGSADSALALLAYLERLNTAILELPAD